MAGKLKRDALSREFSRKSFIKGGGSLVVGFTMAGSLLGARAAAAAPDATQVDAWLKVNADNTVTAYVSKHEFGQGLWTGYRQVVAEELDLAVTSVDIPRFDTGGPHPNPDGGRTAGSNGMAQGGPALRQAAAEARRVLLNLASAQLAVPVASLSVANGVVSGGGKSVTYGQLLGGKLFNTTIQRGATTTAPLKPVSQYKVVGTSVPRFDTPDKVTGRYVYVHNIVVPGMLHGRVVRPRGQAYLTPETASAAVPGGGSSLLSVDESSIRNIPGARVVRRGSFLGVVAPTEYAAIQAAAQLKVTWAEADTLPGTGNLYQAMRDNTTNHRYVINTGDVDKALASAAKVVSARYEWPYQIHGPIGPQAAVADVTASSATVFTATQGAYGILPLVAAALSMPASSVRMIVVEGSSTYGRDAGEDEVPMAAAVMSQLAGKPVRVQHMRWDNHGWDNHGPAAVAEIRGGLDATGKIVAYDYTSISGGTPPTYSTGDQYMPNLGSRRLASKTPPAYLRTGPLRGPGHIQPGWASEQMMDELAYAANMDPLQFRQRHTTDMYWRGVLDGVAKLANWKPKVAASNLSNEQIVTGRGISLSAESHTNDDVDGSVVADIEVDRKTGRIVVKHLYGVQDSGVVVNPAMVNQQLEAMLVTGTSRALLEQTTMSKKRVTSLDWVSYPTLRFKDHPKVTTTYVWRQDELAELTSNNSGYNGPKYRGAGESLIVPTVSAIANAFFDATGVRMRRAPMTPAAVRATLASAGRLYKG